MEEVIDLIIFFGLVSGLVINLKKTVRLMAHATRATDILINSTGERVKCVKEAEYLGVILGVGVTAWTKCQKAFNKCMDRIAMVRRRVHSPSLRAWFINSRAYIAFSYIEQYTCVPEDMLSKVQVADTEAVMLMARPVERTFLRKLHDAGFKNPLVDISARGVAARCRESRAHRENEIGSENGKAK